MGVVERKAREKKAREKSIMDAARHLFQEKGYQSTTMSDISDKAELSKATLYLYFKNKDELFLSITTKPLEELEKDFEKISRSKKRPQDKLTAMFYSLVRHWSNNSEVYRLGDSFFSQNIRANIREELTHTIYEQLLRLVHIGARIIKEGIEQGVFRDDLDPEKFMIVGWRTAAGILQITTQDGLTEEEKLLYDEALDLAFSVLQDVLLKKQ